MKNALVISLLILSLNTLAIAVDPDQAPSLVCVSQTPSIRVEVYGELGSFYEDDIESNSTITFFNHVLITANDLRFELQNSFSTSNDFNDYVVQSFSYDQNSRNLERALILVFESESGNVGHLTVKLSELELQIPVSCQIRQ